MKDPDTLNAAEERIDLSDDNNDYIMILFNTEGESLARINIDKYRMLTTSYKFCASLPSDSIYPLLFKLGLRVGSATAADTSDPLCKPVTATRIPQVFSSSPSPRRM